MKMILMTLALTMTASLQAANATLPVESKIAHVTVYLEGAIVTRKASTNLGKGQHALLFRGLPEGLNKDAIRLKLGASARLLEMDYRQLTPEERGQASIDKLNQSLMVKKAELARTVRLIDARNIDLEFINSKNDIYQRSPAPTVAQIKEMDAFLSKRREELFLEILRLREKRDKQQQEMQKIISQIQLLVNDNLETEHGLVIRVDVSRAGQLPIEIEYFTAKAGWVPVYNIRANSLDQPLEIEMTAQIDQVSGEDWEDAYLSLSTGNPTLTGTMPKLRTWELIRGQGYVPNKSQPRTASSRNGTGGIAGYVFDRHTNESVPFAVVHVVSGINEQNATTDIEGKFEIQNLLEGNYKLEVSAMGMQSAIVENVRVRKGGVTSVRVMMQPDSESLKEVMVTWDKPLIQKGYTSEIVTQEEIKNMPVRSLSSASSTSSSGHRYNYNRSVEPDKTYYDNFSREEQFTTETYTIDKPYTIPADGMPRTVWVNTTSIKADFIHRVRPALDDDAFLLAHITEWEKLRLQKGKALLFLEGTYMGDTYIDPSNTGDTLTLSMGRDKQVAVKRTRVDGKTSRNFIGSSQRENFAYRIELRNNKQMPIKIEVEDQLPVSQDKSISVEKVEISNAENHKLDNEKGFITWTVNLEGTARKELSFSFLISSPKGWGLNLPR